MIKRQRKANSKMRLRLFSFTIQNTNKNTAEGSTYTMDLPFASVPTLYHQLLDTKYKWMNTTFI